MIEMIIKQAKRKIQDAQRRLEIYCHIDNSGALHFLISKEEATIDHLTSMVRELEAEMERVGVTA